MAAIVWPPTLPAPGFNWSETPVPNTVRTPTDTGPAKVRRRFTAQVTNLDLPYDLTKAEADLLVDTFYEVTTAGGSLRFDYPHPRTGATVECRFREPPAFVETNPGLYRGTVRLEVLP